MKEQSSILNQEIWKKSIHPTIKVFNAILLTLNSYLRCEVMCIVGTSSSTFAYWICLIRSWTISIHSYMIFPSQQTLTNLTWD
jgi:hypothetical protein